MIDRHVMPALVPYYSDVTITGDGGICSMRLSVNTYNYKKMKSAYFYCKVLHLLPIVEVQLLTSFYGHPPIKLQKHP